MILFIYVMLIVGIVAGYFYGVDAALLAGKRAVVIWLFAGFMLFMIKPFIDIFRLTKAFIHRLKRKA